MSETVSHDMHPTQGKKPLLQRPWVQVLSVLGLLVGIPAGIASVVVDTKGWWPQPPWSDRGPANTEITIDAPDEPIPMCATLTGSAPVVDDHPLWLAVRPPDDRYYLFPADHHRDEQWDLTTTIGIAGDTGQQFNVFAFYLDEDMSDFLAGFQAHADDGELAADWHVKDLPPGVSDAPNQLFVRSADTEECPE